MRIIPVLDLLDGVVVRAVRGVRREYRPIRSVLTTKTDALSVARTIRDAFNLNELYLADLDGILSQRLNLSVYRQLADEGFSLLVDPGVRDVNTAQQVLETGAAEVIAALETIPGPDLLHELIERFGPDRVVFSLDMQSGQLLGDLELWDVSSIASDVAYDVAAQAVDVGIRRMIVLDLAQVGAHEGVSTISLCQRLMDCFPKLRVYTGGGVRGLEDLLTAKASGIAGVLIASAVHDGSLTREQIGQS